MKKLKIEKFLEDKIETTFDFIKTNFVVSFFLYLLFVALTICSIIYFGE